MLRFCNRYSRTVWVAIEWSHPNCPDGGNWMKEGWWRMEPNECKVAFAGDLDDVNRFWYFYAHAQDGTEWAGEFQDTVPPTAFRWCEHTSSTSARRVGFRQLDIGGNEDYTVNLTP